MTTRREFLQAVPATGAFLSIPGTMAWADSSAPGEPVRAAEPFTEHFHPKGKPPSKFTLQKLAQARKTLPFADKKDFQEQAKGFIAPMKNKKIMADAGHVAWDMERYQFLLEADDFDSIHPSLMRQSVLNMNYGLYEVIPGIYQVRGLDLSDVSFVRGKTGWIVIDPLLCRETARAALQAGPSPSSSLPARSRPPIRP